MDLPLLCFMFGVFSLSLYLLLDGFDLGVGALLLLESDEGRRDQMIDAIAPTWDGNETWLIMAGVTLLAAFPIAYGILLPAFYLPIIAMLMALGLRGVSFEFRFQTIKFRRMWDVVFAAGSVTAALAQGMIVGGLLRGVTVTDSWYAGGPFDWFSGLSIMLGLTLLCGYASLGAGWLRLKGGTQTQALAMRCLRWAPPTFLWMYALTHMIAWDIQPGVSLAWHAHFLSLFFVNLLILALSTLLTLLARLQFRTGDRYPFLLAVFTLLLAALDFVITIFPDVIPFHMTLWAAASGTRSTVFLLVGAVIVTPVVIAYSAFAYWVFRGKTPPAGFES